jgi:hypothetical protein
MKRRHASLLFSVLVIVPITMLAGRDGIEIGNAWSRAAMQGHVGVVYLTILDHGPPDRLTGVSSPVAERAELHESFNDGGVAKMRPVTSLAVEPAKPVVFAPGGYHIMLMGLKQPLKRGDVFPITLTFAKAGQLTAKVAVEQQGATMPMGVPVRPSGTPGKQP